MPVPAPRFDVWVPNAPGVASKMSEVVTMPRDLPCVREKVLADHFHARIVKRVVVSSGKTPCWLLFPLLPVE